MSILKVVAGTFNIPLSSISVDASNEDLYLICDSTLGPITIVLPEISTMPFLNPRIYAYDSVGKAQTNNISFVRTNLDTINGLSADVVISQNGGSAKVQATSTVNWISTVGAGGAPAFFTKIGTIGFAAVNAGAAAATFTSTISNGKPVGFYATNYATVVTTPFVSSGGDPTPNLKSIGQQFDVDNSEINFSAPRTITGGIQAAMVATEKGNIDIVLEFAGAVVNPKNYTAGSVDIYAEFAPMPF